MRSSCLTPTASHPLLSSWQLPQAWAHLGHGPGRMCPRLGVVTRSSPTFLPLCFAHPGPPQTWLETSLWGEAAMWGAVAAVPTFLPKVQEQRAPKPPRTFRQARHAKKTKRKEKPRTPRSGVCGCAGHEEEGLGRAKALPCQPAADKSPHLSGRSAHPPSSAHPSEK